MEREKYDSSLWDLEKMLEREYKALERLLEDTKYTPEDMIKEERVMFCRDSNGYLRVQGLDLNNYKVLPGSYTPELDEVPSDELDIKPKNYRYLGKFEKLESLTLKGQNLGRKKVDYSFFEKLPNLNELNLMYNELSNKDFTKIAEHLDLSKLRYLELEGNKIDAPTILGVIRKGVMGGKGYNIEIVFGGDPISPNSIKMNIKPKAKIIRVSKSNEE